MQLLTNHIGYEKKATKQAVIQALLKSRYLLSFP